MSKNNPKYSLVIPCFNEENYIQRTIKSLQKQDYKGDYEILIVDNNCTDKTVEIAEALGAKVAQNTWVNYAQQFNFGIKNNPFNTKWLMRMDADEYVLPELTTEINEKLRFRAQSPNNNG